MRLSSNAILGACLSVLHAVDATEFGAGFGLSIDYGHVSSYYALNAPLD
jgi:uncharacterized membrane protein